MSYNIDFSVATNNFFGGVYVVFTSYSRLNGEAFAVRFPFCTGLVSSKAPLFDFHHLQPIVRPCNMCPSVMESFP